MNTSCFCTGHRILNIDNELLKKVKELFLSLIDEGVTDFYAGGALGFDMVCEFTVLKIKEKINPNVKLHMVLPCELSEQCKNWERCERSENQRICRYADSVEVVSNKYYNGCMKKETPDLRSWATFAFAIGTEEKGEELFKRLTWQRKR